LDVGLERTALLNSAQQHRIHGMGEPMVAKPHAASQDSLARSGQGKGIRADKVPRGYGWMRDVPLNIDPRIDLTQPIYEQVLALEKADREAAERG